VGLVLIGDLTCKKRCHSISHVPLPPSTPHRTFNVFSTMLSCFSWPTYKERWSILLLGDNDVGKTSFAYRFSDDVFEENFGKLVFSSDHVKECYFDEDNSCSVCLSDTWVAQSSYTDMYDTIPFNHGVILMYSIGSRVSFQDISRTCRQLPLDAKKDPRLVLVLVGTKSDDDLAREVSTDEGAALAQGLGCKGFFETSAKLGENIDAAVFAMVQALRQAESDRKIGLSTPFKLIAGLPSYFRTTG